MLPGGEGKGRALGQRNSGGNCRGWGHRSFFVDQRRVLGGPGGTVRRRLEREVVASRSFLLELVSENKSDTGPLLQNQRTQEIQPLS